jgi:hypothetical protein
MIAPPQIDNRHFRTELHPIRAPFPLGRDVPLERLAGRAQFLTEVPDLRLRLACAAPAPWTSSAGKTQALTGPGDPTVLAWAAAQDRVLITHDVT